MTDQERAHIVVDHIDDWVNSLWDYCVDLGRIVNATEEEVASLSPELQIEYHNIIDGIIDMDINEEEVSRISIAAHDWIDKSHLDLEV